MNAPIYAFLNAIMSFDNFNGITEIRLIIQIVVQIKLHSFYYEIVEAQFKLHPNGILCRKKENVSFILKFQKKYFYF